MKPYLTLAALALALSCSKPAPEAPSAEPAAPPEPAGPPAVAEAEPNDESRAPQRVAGPARVNATITGENDDWFAFEASTPTLLRLELSGSPHELTLETYDAERNIQLRLTSHDESGVAIPNLLCSGQCLFRIASVRKDASGPYSFQLVPSAPTQRSEREPNSRAVDAQPIGLGQSIDGFLATADDEDWYLLKTEGLPADKVVQLALASPPGVRCELSVIRTSDEAPLATYRAPETGQDIRLRNLAAPELPDTGYLIVVRSALVPQPNKKSIRLFDAKVPYTLEVKAAPGAPGLESEPNDDPAHATLLELDGEQASRTGFLAPRGDVDWFLFHTEVPSIVRVDVTGLDKVNLVLSVIDPEKKNDEKGNEWARSDMGGVKEPEAVAGVAVPAGDNYLRVDTAWKKVDDRSIKDYENTIDPYTLTLHVTPDDGTWEREPNQTIDTATPIEPGRTMQGYIQPAKDVDHWSLSVHEPTTLAITVSAVPRLDLVLIVKDLGKDASIIGTVDRNRIEAEERLVVPFEPGSYVIEVKDRATGNNPAKPYSITLK